MKFCLCGWVGELITVRVSPLPPLPLKPPLSPLVLFQLSPSIKTKLERQYSYSGVSLQFHTTPHPTRHSCCVAEAASVLLLYKIIMYVTVDG